MWLFLVLWLILKHRISWDRVWRMITERSPGLIWSHVVILRLKLQRFYPRRYIAAHKSTFYDLVDFGCITCFCFDSFLKLDALQKFKNIPWQAPVQSSMVRMLKIMGTSKGINFTCKAWKKWKTTHGKPGGFDMADLDILWNMFCLKLSLFCEEPSYLRKKKHNDDLTTEIWCFLACHVRSPRGTCTRLLGLLDNVSELILELHPSWLPGFTLETHVYYIPFGYVT